MKKLLLLLIIPFLSFTQNCTNISITGGCPESQMTEISPGVYECDWYQLFAYETTWSLYGPSFSTGGTIPADLNPCLEDGCYTLTMQDTFGDGWFPLFLTIGNQNFEFSSFGGGPWGGANSQVVTFGIENGIVTLDSNCAEDCDWWINNNSNTCYNDALNYMEYGEDWNLPIGEDSLYNNYVDYVEMTMAYECHCVSGCTDSSAVNYQATSIVNDGLCYYNPGCTDSTADNYNSDADYDNDTCIYAADCLQTSISVYTQAELDSYADCTNILNVNFPCQNDGSGYVCENFDIIDLSSLLNKPNITGININGTSINDATLNELLMNLNNLSYIEIFNNNSLEEINIPIISNMGSVFIHNTSLISISFFDNSTSTLFNDAIPSLSDLMISQNNDLVEIHGIGDFYISFYMQIFDNPSLETISGSLLIPDWLESNEMMGIVSEFFDNPLLTSCCPIQQHFQANWNNFFASLMAWGNGYGCNEDDQENQYEENCVAFGCTDEVALNYDETANLNDGTCIYPVFGCLDELAYNYDSSATDEDGSCEYCDLNILSTISGNVCSGGNADIVVAVEGGSGNYSYQWSNGVVGSANLNLAEGSYSLAVFDLNTLCTEFAMFEVDAFEDQMELEANIDYNLGSCATATINVIGGAPPYTYESAGALQSSNVIENICSGEQLIIVTDSNGCTESISVSIMSSPDWDVVSTDANHIILIPGDANLTFENNPLSMGSYIGVFYTNQYDELICGGYVIWEGETTSIAAWGSETGLDNGFENGEEFIWGIWDVNTGEVQYGNAEYIFNPPSLTSQGNYTAYGLSGIESITTPAPIWSYNITAGNHIIALSNLDIYIDDEALEYGDWMGVFYTDDYGNLACGGMTMWTGENIAMAAWGDDLYTDEKDGFAVGDEFIWKIWNYSDGDEFQTNATYHTEIYNEDLATNPYVMNGWMTMPQTAYFSINGLSAAESFSTYLNQTIEILDGWGIISTYLTPENPNLASVFSSITDDENLIIVKNQFGEVYWPEYNLNSIGDLSVGEGYQIKVNNADELLVSGTLSSNDTPITLSNWSILGYLHRESANTADMMAPLTGDFNPSTNGYPNSELIIMKDEEGLVYWPEYNLNSIGDMLPGKGYQVKTTNDIIFVYPALESGRFSFDNYMDFASLKYPKPINTGNNMILAIPDDIWLDKPSVGDEIIILDQDGLIVGNDRYREEVSVITIWGDDETTIVKDGLQIGEEFSIKLLRINDNNEEYIDILSWKEGSGLYSINGISIAGTLSQNTVQEKQIIKINDVLGRETTSKGFQLHIYDDGSVEKRYIID